MTAIQSKGLHELPADRRRGRLWPEHWVRAFRFGWGLADQSLSSLTNFGATLMVARTVPVSEFGVFALGFATYTLGLGASRALTGEPLVARFSIAAPESWRTGVRRSTGAALALGTVFGVLSFVAAFAFFHGSMRATFEVLGLTFPGLILQDSWRYAFFASPDNRRAFFNDLVWACLLLPALPLAVVAGTRSASGFMLIWGLSGTAAALFGSVQGKVIPRPQEALVWVRSHSDLGMRFLAEFLALTGATQFMLFGLAAVSGVSAVAAIRGGLVVMGPINILLMGVALVAVPEGVRLAGTSINRLRKLCLGISLALSSAAILWGIIALLIPDTLGTAILGETWQTARPTLLPIAFWVAGNGAVAGAVVGLRALQAAKRSLRAQLVSASARLVLGLSGGAFAGAAGAAWGVAVATGSTSLLWWNHLSGALGERATDDASVTQRVLEASERASDV
jgi:hypothetical protein